MTLCAGRHCYEDFGVMSGFVPDLVPAAAHKAGGQL